MPKCLKILIFLCFLLNVNCIITNKIVKGYDEEKTFEAIYIIINTLNSIGIFKIEDMEQVLRAENLKRHEDCKEPRHDLRINFVDGEINDKGYKCIYSDAEHLKGQCLSGLFDGKHTITIVKSEHLHKTSLAHEMYHYFQRYIEDEPRPIGAHEPIEIWENLFGFGSWARGIGLVNEALKDKGY